MQVITFAFDYIANVIGRVDLLLVYCLAWARKCIWL